MDQTNNSRKAGALILSNLAIFNDAAILMEQEIEVQIFEKIHYIIQDWMLRHDFNGETEWNNDNLWFAPKRWKISSDERDFQCASFWFGHEEDSSSYNLADLCGCGQTRMGFYFGKDNVVKNKIWKNSWQVLPDNSLQILDDLGFVFYNKAGGQWFLPITLDNSKLASAYEDDDYNDPESVTPTGGFVAF